MKVIEPLFLDDLRADFERAKKLKRGREAALKGLHDRLADMVLFDPACGCGNFLIISYRELRLLEIELLKEVHPSGQRDVLAQTLSRVDVDQFYGIEIDEFPARIAEVAMWMMDHIMNNRLSYEFGQVFARIPLQKSAQIVNGDALEIQWETVCPPDRCTYLLGNPPFIGAKQQTPAQRAQIVWIADLGRTGGTLDYVAAWFLKAGMFMNAGTSRTAFVSTNSITQGEQTAQLWPSLFDRSRLEISFAHRTFPWGSDARGVAHVHVVIVGLAKTGEEPHEKRLFSYPDAGADPVETSCSVISPYLFDATGFPNPKLTVREVSAPINGAPRLKTGVQMIDDGIMTFTADEKAEFLADEPGAAPWFRQFLGGDEYINGFSRWILYLREAQPAALRVLPMVQSRIKRLKKYRADSTRAQTIAMAAFPQRLGVDERLERPYLVIPNTSSERRDYIPIGWLEPEIIANQKLRILADALPWQFAILTSRMHMAWMRAITGRMKSDYMYSVGVVYNNFPWPALNDASKKQLISLELPFLTRVKPTRL